MEIIKLFFETLARHVMPVSVNSKLMIDPLTSFTFIHWLYFFKTFLSLGIQIQFSASDEEAVKMKQ